MGTIVERDFCAMRGHLRPNRKCLLRTQQALWQALRPMRVHQPHTSLLKLWLRTQATPKVIGEKRLPAWEKLAQSKIYLTKRLIRVSRSAPNSTFL